jgi:hypothetical protein
MKNSLFSAVFSTLALVALQTTATPLPTPINGPVTIAWTIDQQNLDDMAKYPGDGKTSVSGSGANKATNVLQIYTDSFKTISFNNASLLKLLANSLNTTPFPATTKLVTDGSALYVVDHTGTNVIASITNVVTVAPPTNLNAEVTSGVDTTIQTSKKTGYSETAVEGGSGNQFLIVSYDDSGLTTTDGTTTTFTFYGISAFTRSGSSTLSDETVTVKEKGSFTIHGQGYGTIRGTNSIISGTIVGSPSGTFSESEPAVN